MKKINLWVFMICVAVLASASSCPERRAYETLKGTKTASESAVKTAARLHHSGVITDAQWFKVEEVHDTKFVPAFNTAVELASQDYSQPTPVLVRTYLMELLDLVDQLKNN